MKVLYKNYQGAHALREGAETNLNNDVNYLYYQKIAYDTILFCFLNEIETEHIYEKSMSHKKLIYVYFCILGKISSF